MEDQNYALVGFREIGNNIKRICINNKAHILTGLSVAGTITTGILSARSGAISARKIDRREQELGRRLTPGEKIKLCGKDFIAPVASGIVSVAGSIGSDIINTQTIARTNVSLIASEKAYEALNRKTKEVLGEKKTAQIKDEIAKEKADIQKIVTQEALDAAPRSGNGAMYPFVDSYSGLLFYSNLDYINSVVLTMQNMMQDMHERGDEFDYYDKEVGVHYTEWLRALGFDESVWKTRERLHQGWNRGFDPKGIDDDAIYFYRTTDERQPGFAVTIINWDPEPKDMRLGRLLKSNGQ